MSETIRKHHEALVEAVKAAVVWIARDSAARRPLHYRDVDAALAAALEKATERVAVSAENTERDLRGARGALRAAGDIIGRQLGAKESVIRETAPETAEEAWTALTEGQFDIDGRRESAERRLAAAERNYNEALAAATAKLGAEQAPKAANVIMAKRRIAAVKAEIEFLAAARKAEYFRAKARVEALEAQGQ